MTEPMKVKTNRGLTVQSIGTPKKAPINWQVLIYLYIYGLTMLTLSALGGWGVTTTNYACMGVCFGICGVALAGFIWMAKVLFSD